MLSSVHQDVYLDILSSLLEWRNIQGKELKKNSTDLLRGEEGAETLTLANMTFHDICSVLVTNGEFKGRRTGLRKESLSCGLLLHHTKHPESHSSNHY